MFFIYKAGWTVKWKINRIKTVEFLWESEGKTQVFRRFFWKISGINGNFDSYKETQSWLFSFKKIIL